jgi:aryl-alcohol dehydrogenase-like predicted oxidoreductase
VALAWLLARPAVTSLVVGARTEEQLQANLGAADLDLSAEDLRRIEDAVAAVEVQGERYPEAMQRTIDR